MATKTKSKKLTPVQEAERELKRLHKKIDKAEWDWTFKTEHVEQLASDIAQLEVVTPADKGDLAVIAQAAARLIAAYWPGAYGELHIHQRRHKDGRYIPDFH